MASGEAPKEGVKRRIGGGRRGTSPKYKRSHFPEKADTGQFQEK